MATPPRFFIVRPDTKRTSADGTVHTIPGPIVPLIAIDELPEWLDIVGVPRQLDVEQTIGLCNLGTASKSKVSYDVKITHNATPMAGSQTSAVKSIEAKEQVAVAAPPQTGPRSPAAMASLSATHMPGPATAATPPASHPADRMRDHWNDAVTKRPGGVGNSIHNPQQPQPQPHAREQRRQQQRQPPGPTTSPTPTNKLITTTTTDPVTPRPPTAPETEYCRHWCHHGTCKWGLHCRHLHAMPTTPAELAEVGLREIPAWWVATAAGLGLGRGGHPHPHPHHHRHHHQPLYPLSPPLSHVPSRLQSQSDSESQSYSHSHQRGAKEIGLGDAGGDGGADGGAGGGLGAFDPRDVRAGVMRRMGVLSPHAAVVMGAFPSSGGGGGGGGAGGSKKVVRALLRELGLRTGNGTGRGRMGEANNNPMEKGMGKNAEKEGLLRAARAEMASAAAAVVSCVAAAPPSRVGTGDVVRQRQIGTAGAGQEKKGEEGKNGGGPGTVGMAQGVVTQQQLGKLVDV